MFSVFFIFVLHYISIFSFFFFFFFNDTATTEIYTLSLHDALPIYSLLAETKTVPNCPSCTVFLTIGQTIESTSISHRDEDRKSTRLNSSHVEISYAVFCLKKKKKKKNKITLKQKTNHISIH